MFSPSTRGSKGNPAPVRRSSTLTPASVRGREGSAFKRGISQGWSRRSLNDTRGGLERFSHVDGHTLAEYGSALPVSVTEALTTVECEQRPSVNLDKTGWAWLVSGRKLIIWNFQKLKTSGAGRCHELLLPQTTSSHHASLVRVLELNGSTACVMVSREGTVRWWRNITQEGGMSEVKLELSAGGDEAKVIITLQAGLCVIGTIQGALFAIVPGLGQAGLTYRAMKVQQGTLGRFGKGLQSLLSWQSSQSGSATTVLHSLVAGEIINHDTQAIYLLKSDGLEKWTVSHNSHKILYQFDVASAFRENIAEVCWSRHPSQLSTLITELIDMQPINDGVMILGAGVHQNTSQDVRYALGTLHTEGDQPPQSFLSFSVINHTSVYDNESRSLPRYCLLLTQPMPKYIFLYDTETIVSIADGRSNQTPEVVEFRNLGGGSHEGLAVFLSASGYLVCIQDKQPLAAHDTSASDTLLKTSSFAALDTSIVTSAKKFRITPGSSADDRHTRLKAAFLASIQDSVEQSQALVDELFPPGSHVQRDSGSSLDVLVTDLSREMIDDYPASDPRWSEALPRDAGSSTASLILLHQLDDKLRAHELYLRFLKNCGLWDRLCTIQLRGSVMQTTQVLCEHAEKIEATKALRELHVEHEKLVSATIEEVVRQRGTVSPSPALTSHDLFYRQVSGIDDFILCLVEYVCDLLNTNISTSETIYLISAVNTICLAMLLKAHEYRSMQQSVYSCTSATSRTRNRSSQEEFVTWTSSTGRHGLRDALKCLHTLTVDRGLPDSDETSEMRSLFFHQLLQFTDLILDGYREQLQGLRGLSVVESSQHYTQLQQLYEKERTLLIEPFLRYKQHERATTLSEKFCDFTSLIRLCEEMKNEERLKHYMQQFRDEGFSDFVFKWYMDAGRRGKLMTSDLSSNPMLARFLQSKENQFLSWIHHLNTNNYDKAHKTLLDLAKLEENYLSKKKTLLSLSKLAALAGDDSSDTLLDTLESIDNDLTLIMHQEQLFMNEDINERVGVEGDRMKVLNAIELIELLIDEYNPHATEVDFKKALDLIQFINQDASGVNTGDILLRIWAKAVLKDRWNRTSTTDPVDVCRDTVFYKLVHLVIAEEMDMKQYVPSVEDLLGSQLLDDLNTKPDFIYLLRGLYEHLARTVQAVD